MSSLNFEPPPTYADPVLVDDKTKKSQFNPIWLKWFVDLTQVLSAFASGSGSGINHNTLAGLQGGMANEYYHLTAASFTYLTALPNPITVSYGGMGLTTLTAHALQVGNGTSPPTQLGLGTTTTVLHGNASSDPSFSAVVEADITLADNATNNASTARHGFLLKLNNSATQFMNGQGAWATPVTLTAPKQTVYTTGSGTHTITGSPLYVTIKMIGGGGGAGGSGTAGGSAGGNGGDTTFGAFTAGKGFGGTEGTGAAKGVGGAGGTAAGSPNFSSPGAQGDSQFAALFSGTHGAASFYGGGGLGGDAGAAGSAATCLGAGGGGAGGAAGVVNAGGGGGSAATVEHLYTSVAASYSYGVGAAGTAGTAGTAGFAGGAGAAGTIIVTEYYQ